jgi:hypothetical protein
MDVNTSQLMLCMQRWNQLREKGDKEPLLAAAENFLQKNFGVASLPKFFGDGLLYDQQDIAPGTTAFFDGVFSKARTNMPGSSFILPQSEHMIILGIQAWENISTDALDECDWLPGISDPIAKNGNFQIMVDGNNMTPYLPATVFDNNQQTTGTAGATNAERGIYRLQMPIAWVGQTQLKLNFVLNNGKTPTTNSKLRFGLVGLRFYGNN